MNRDATEDAYVLAAYFGITPESIRQWASRGHIKRYGYRNGRTLYRFVEVRDMVRNRDQYLTCPEAVSQ